MYNHSEPAANSIKLRPFLRPAAQTRQYQPAVVPPLLPALSVPAVARLAQPMLVRKALALPALSPAAAVAHDARNALMALQLLSGLLEEPGVLAPEHTYLGGDLQMIAQVLSGMVGRIERLDKSLESAVTAQPVTVIGAGEALTQCTGLLRSVAGSGVQVFISAESGLPPLQIEPDALARVLMNLVKNASEAMPGGGTVRITARHALSRTSPAVLIHVTDTGTGIPAHALERIFEPGFSSKSASSGEPCGLGLAIVRELVESVGGEVRVASKRRSGTTFELKIPCIIQDKITRLRLS